MVRIIGRRRGSLDPEPVTGRLVVISRQCLYCVFMSGMCRRYGRRSCGLRKRCIRYIVSIFDGRGGVRAWTVLSIVTFNDISHGMGVDNAVMRR